MGYMKEEEEKECTKNKTIAQAGCYCDNRVQFSNEWGPLYYMVTLADIATFTVIPAAAGPHLLTRSCLLCTPGLQQFSNFRFILVKDSLV